MRRWIGVLALVLALAVPGVARASSSLGKDGVMISHYPYWFTSRPSKAQVALIAELLPWWGPVGGFAPHYTQRGDAAILSSLRSVLAREASVVLGSFYMTAADQHNMAVTMLGKMRSHPSLLQHVPAYLTADGEAYLAAYAEWYYEAGSILATQSHGINPARSYEVFVSVHKKLWRAWSAMAAAVNAMGQRVGIPSDGTMNLLLYNSEAGPLAP